MNKLVNLLDKSGLSSERMTRQQLQQMAELMSNLNAHREVPCFIVASRRLGRSSFARLYAGLYHQAAQTRWLDATDPQFLTSSARNGLLACGRRHRPASAEGRGLLVIDDLALLDESLAERFSNNLDELIEQGWQVVVITTPQNDCYQRLQSDRFVISGQDLLCIRDFSEEQRGGSLAAFLSDSLPVELRIFALLTILASRLSVEQAAAAGVVVHEDVPANLAALHPFFTRSDTGGELLVQAPSPVLLKTQIIAVLEEYVRQESLPGQSLPASDGTCSTELSTDAVRRRALEIVTRVSILLLERAEHHRSSEVLAFAESHLLKPTSADSDNVPARSADTHEPTQAATIEPAAQKGAAFRCASTDTVPMLHIRLFGGLEVYRGEQFVEHTALRSSRARQLLIHLAFAYGRGIAQDTLVERYWPERAGNRGYENLYVLWSRLGRILSSTTGRECPYLLREAGVLKLNERLVSVDTALFEEKAREVLFGDGEGQQRIALAQELEAIYGCGIILDKFSDRHIRASAERLRSLYVDVLMEAARLSEFAGNQVTALWMARKAYETDTSKEEVYRTLMDAQIKAGRRTSAMQTFFACKAFLSEELGILPSQLTMNLYQDLLMDSG
ncbi:MAG: hypothetical protein LBP28_04410 [Coriobacteriales bacterium]|nr:hypothetical protein [Coriobacteriales bacterium]